MAELELQVEESRRLRKLVDEDLEIVAIAGLDLRVRFLNSTGRRRLGVGTDVDLSDRTLAEVFRDTTANGLTRGLVPVALREGTARGELRVRIDPEAIIAETTVTAHGQSDSSPPYISVVMRPIERTQSGEWIRHLYNTSGLVLYACKPDGDMPATYISPNALERFGFPASAFLEDPTFWVQHVHPEDLERVFAGVGLLFEQGHHRHEYRFLHADGRYRWVEDEFTLLKDEDGNPAEVVGTWKDITPAREAEHMIRQQAEALNVLSTPLIPISERAVAMPIIGQLDDARVKRALETLLTGVTTTGAEVAILDVTGVDQVDKAAVAGLISTAQAVRLLGAEVVITGIRPEVARMFVEIGDNLETIVTLSTLRAGIAYAMDVRRRPRAAWRAGGSHRHAR